MTFEEVKARLDAMLLMRALWWYVEHLRDGNVSEEVRIKLYLYLRERYYLHEGIP